MFLQCRCRDLSFMSRHHCLTILPASELRYVFLGCDHFPVCMTTSCCDFYFLVTIVLVVFLPSYVSILCRDLMVMSRHLLFPTSFLLVATSVLHCNTFPPSHPFSRSRPQVGVATSISSAQLFFRSRPYYGVATSFLILDL